jgi:hypothetical protein
MSEFYTLYVNHNQRDAHLMAELDDGRQLYEYDMPGGTSGLIELTVCDQCDGIGVSGPNAPGPLDYCPICGGTGFTSRRTISYPTLPIYWIRAMLDAGNGLPNMAFNPQRTPYPAIVRAKYRFHDIADAIDQEKRDLYAIKVDLQTFHRGLTVNEQQLILGSPEYHALIMASQTGVASMDLAALITNNDKLTGLRLDFEDGHELTIKVRKRP